MNASSEPPHASDKEQQQQQSPIDFSASLQKLFIHASFPKPKAQRYVIDYICPPTYIDPIAPPTPAPSPRPTPPTARCFTPSTSRLAALVERTDWRHVDEDAHLAKVIKQQMDNEHAKLLDPNSSMNQPMPKQWRTHRVSYEGQIAMWHEQQGSTEWHTNRLFSTGSAGTLAAYCGWLHKYTTSVEAFQMDAGLVIRKPLSAFNWFCMMRGNYGEDTVDTFAGIIMGTRSVAFGMVLHKNFHCKHSSPDRLIFYLRGVFHNKHMIWDMRRGLREIKYTVVYPAICQHYGKTLKECEREKRGIVWRHLPRPYYVIQMMDQLEVMTERLTSHLEADAWKYEDLWNDFTTMWKSNHQQQQILLKDASQFIGPVDAFVSGETWLVGEFHCTRVYFNKSMIDQVYEYFHAHRANVGKAEELLKKGVPREDIPLPELVKCPHVGKVKLLPMKHVQFVRYGESEDVFFFIEDCWEYEPFEVTLGELEHW